MSVLDAVLLILLAGILSRAAVRSSRRRRRRRIEAEAEALIPLLSVADLDPAFRVGALGPSRERTEVTFLGGGDVLVPGSTSDFEAWVLAVLAKRARRMFEFGTCTGRTTYLWAKNSPPDAVVTTITLAPGDVKTYAAGQGDAEVDRLQAVGESRFERFLYTDTPAAAKVEQLFGDSKALDETPYLGTMDLIFVDGSHAYSYVMSDTEKALRMIKPGGLILWHDYDGPITGRGTDLALLDLARKHPLHRLAGTRMVAYRAPKADPGEPRSSPASRAAP